MLATRAVSHMVMELDIFHHKGTELRPCTDEKLLLLQRTG